MTEIETVPLDTPSLVAMAADSHSGADCPQGPAERGLSAPAERFDRRMHAALARATGGVSPAAWGLAWLDWAWHLASSPGKQMTLAQQMLHLVEPASGRAWHGQWRPALCRSGLGPMAVSAAAGHVCAHTEVLASSNHRSAWSLFPP